MPRGRKTNPLRLNSQGKPKSPFYFWLQRKGKDLFLERYGIYYDQSENHHEQMTEIWHSIPPDEKQSYYEKCGKVWNGRNGGIEAPKPSAPAATSANNQMHSARPVTVQPKATPSTSQNLQPDPTWRPHERKCSPIFGMSVPIALKPVGLVDLKEPTKAELTNLFRDECSRLYDHLHYHKVSSSKFPNLCLGTDFYFITVASTCSILFDDDITYTFPSEVAILRFSLEEGLKAKESIRVAFSSNLFTNCSFPLVESIQLRAQAAGSHFRLNPMEGTTPREAYSKYIDFVDTACPLIYIENEIELITSTLRALSFPVHLNKNNLFSLQSLCHVICQFSAEQNSPAWENRIYTNFIEFLEMNVSYAREMYCQSHAELSISTNAPNFNCPLAYSISKLHLFFEYLNHFDMLGISKFYREESHVFCLSHVGARSDGYVSSSSHSDRVDEVHVLPEQFDKVLTIDRSRSLKSRSPTNAYATDSNEDFKKLREIFGKWQGCWVVLPEVCFDHIPDFV